MSETQFVDPAVSRKKFNREVAEFRSQADEYIRRGWYLAKAKFPHVLVVLATAKTQPVMILCGISFDYSNYDAVPPSVRLVHPLTCEPYKFKDLPTKLTRRLPETNPPYAVQGQVGISVQQVQDLMGAHNPDDVPFLCIAGVCEYHDHPAHSGDHWELHRPLGAGCLTRLVDIVSKYGLETIDGFNVQFIPQIHFKFGVPPE